MLPWHQTERQRNRSLTLALGVSLVLHLVLALLPFSRFLGSPGGATTGAGGTLGGPSRFLSGALQAAEVHVQQPPPPPARAEPEPEPQEVPEPPEELVEAPATQNPATGPQDVSARDAAGATQGTGSPAEQPGNGGIGTDDGPPAPPPEAAIRPRYYIHPYVPQEILRKRKIDDYVLVQALVGTDGRVRDVRVLRSIPNCPECTSSAVQSVRQYEYPPYVFHGQAIEIWTVPISFEFSHGR